MGQRTHMCGEVRKHEIGKQVELKGWVQKRRDLGGLIFIDLRDRSGIVQVVVNPETAPEALAIAETVRSEYVLHVKGEIVARDEKAINKKMANGDVEVLVSEIVILNASKTPPFAIENETDVAEDVRLKHRYLDLRRPSMFETFSLRHKATKAVRDFLDSESFLDIETPILTKSTPEGARDYLVPSRVHGGEFYALPQSPQLFKQLLMVAGFERYYQIARCFRDEDLRADRQPEFTQIDIETSFLGQEEIIEMTERMMVKVMKDAKGMDIAGPFPRMTYDEAVSRYGSDKPDTRFEMELINVSEFASTCGFKVFHDAVDGGGEVKALNVKGAADKYSRKDIDALTEFVKRYGAKGLAWLKVTEEGLTGPIAKFFTEDGDTLQQIVEGEAGDLILFVADKKSVVADSLGALRSKLGKDLGLIDESVFNFLWVTDWPLLEFDEEANRYTAAHHPFTMPVREDIELLDTEPARVRAQAYDLVLNGYELGGGSLRIYERDIQEKMFGILGFNQEEANEQFGFLLEAFDYGTPPHGGIALGLDRLVMILASRTNIRDTIAFPKTASASCLLTQAPGAVAGAQLEELRLQLVEESK